MSKLIESGAMVNKINKVSTIAMTGCKTQLNDACNVFLQITRRLSRFASS